MGSGEVGVEWGVCVCGRDGVWQGGVGLKQPHCSPPPGLSAQMTQARMVLSDLSCPLGGPYSLFS